jgi:spore coat protein H
MGCWAAGLLLSVSLACTRAPEEDKYEQAFLARSLPADWEPFDNRFLHFISIQVAPEHLEALENDTEQRIPCDITLNGVVVRNAGIRKKGGAGSMSPLADKPGWSLKFDELVPGQSYHGLGRLLLNNALQDRSLLNEHLAYSLYRRAGLAAPRTAHALVVFNGKPYGFYVVREAFDKRFLREAFGDGRGNLYEGGCCMDFAAPLGNPALLELKNEQEERRTREDLEALAAVVETAPDDTLEQELEALLDVDAFLTGYALEAALAHWDGFAFNLNNYYLYRRPRDGRFVFLPHGMDQLMDRPGFEPLQEPRSRLTRRIWEHPSLNARFRERLLQVVREVWDEPSLREQAEAVRALVETTPRQDARVRRELEDFRGASSDQVQRFEERRVFLEELLTR